MKSCVVVYNPKSGKQRKSEFFDEIKKTLQEYGYFSTIISTKYQGHATEIVEEVGHVDLLISIGGDGTFNEIMTGNFHRKERLLLAHIPLGTTNDIGSMYGYGKSILGNLRLVLEGTVKKVDICLLNNHPFVYVAGLGKFLSISYDTPSDLKKKFGYLAYLIAGLKEFGGKTKTYDVEYEVNGEIHCEKCSFLLVSNANRIAGIDDFYKSVKLDDNAFEVLLCGLTSKADIVRSLYLLTTKDITKVPGFKFYKTSSFKIKFSELPIKSWCIDGEKFESNSLEYNISIERGISLLIPNKNIPKLFIDEES